MDLKVMYKSFVLVSMISDIIQQRVTNGSIVLEDISDTIRETLDTPIDDLYGAIISELKQADKEGLVLEGDNIEELLEVKEERTDAEWFEYITDLIDKF